MTVTNQLDRSGIAMDEQTSDESVFSRDTTPNATIFWPNDAERGYRQGGRRESFQQMYKRFWGYHTGLYNGWWTDASKQNRLDKLNLAEIMTGALEMTPPQRNKAIALLKYEITDMRKFNSRHPKDSTTQTVILALSAYVCHHDGRTCHPNDEQFDELFGNMKESIGIRESYYRRVYGRLEQMLLRSRPSKTPRKTPTKMSVRQQPAVGQSWPFKTRR